MRDLLAGGNALQGELLVGILVHQVVGEDLVVFHIVGDGGLTVADGAQGGVAIAAVLVEFPDVGEGGAHESEAEIVDVFLRGVGAVLHEEELLFACRHVESACEAFEVEVLGAIAGNSAAGGGIAGIIVGGLEAAGLVAPVEDAIVGSRGAADHMDAAAGAVVGSQDAAAAHHAGIG